MLEKYVCKNSARWILKEIVTRVMALSIVLVCSCLFDGRGAPAASGEKNVNERRDEKEAFG